MLFKYKYSVSLFENFFPQKSITPTLTYFTTKNKMFSFDIFTFFCLTNLFFSWKNVTEIYYHTDRRCSRQVFVRDRKSWREFVLTLILYLPIIRFARRTTPSPVCAVREITLIGKYYVENEITALCSRV